MPDKFDPYREALVVETNTIWPEEHSQLESSEKQRMEEALHADPRRCSHLEYVRMHTGFCRQITVTTEDIQRLRS
jgi:zona occludens toxin (predicted ATPase)